MKITLLGPAHPYRGGLAAIMQTMARIFQNRGHEVNLRTFTLQYPALLFPGKSQTTDAPAPEDLQIVRCVNTVNPLNWWKIGRQLKRERPDIILLKYWTPFMAPAFGTIARIARRNGHTRVLCQIDNVAPHEYRIIDRPFNRYFLGAVDGFIYMSEQVHRELEEYTDAPALYSPHPRFEQFGERIDRNEACRNLALPSENRYFLFFGLIRDYKGLHLLLDAWARLKQAGKCAGRKLIVAGEFYTKPEPYLQQIADLGLTDDVILHDRFIPDNEVCNYFSVAEAVVLPYLSATQSGVTQIAYQFCTPMIVTRVGGLPEIVPDGRVGLVCEPTVESLTSAIAHCFVEGVAEEFARNCIEERKRFSWDAMCDRIEELYGVVREAKK